MNTDIELNSRDITADTNEEEYFDKLPAIGVRHGQVFLMFTLLILAVGMRAQMAVAVVAMTDISATQNPNVPVYYWNDKNLILSSFFWGYPVLQLCAAVLGRRYGSKYFILGGMLLNTFAHFFIPFMAKILSSYGIMVCEFIKGLAQGLFYPSVYNILANWIPLSERSQMSFITLSGGILGTILATSITGYISSTRAGWPWSIHFCVFLCIIWIVVYFHYGESFPSTHADISEAEICFIENETETESGYVRIPWNAIVKSLPFWASLISLIGYTWTYQTLLVETPNYLNKIIKFNILTIGEISAVPYIISIFLVLTTSYTANYLINTKITSKTCSSKVLIVIGSIVSAVAFCCMQADGTTESVILLIIAISGQSIVLYSILVNLINLSPNFSEVLLGICNTVTEIISIFGPMAVHIFVVDESNAAHWRIIFVTIAVSLIFCVVIFVCMGSAKVQSWNKVDLKGNESTNHIQEN